MPTPPNRRLTDPRELSALAHPLRVAILEQLTINGQMTATELGDALDATPANCSWHLRKLAGHGFVEEGEAATGRRRPWRVTSVGFDWGEEDLGPEGARASQALNRMLLERWADRFHAALVRAETDDEPWRDAPTLMQTATWLTPGELAEMAEEMGAVIRKYRDRLTEPDQRPEGSRLCEFVAWGAPTRLVEQP